MTDNREVAAIVAWLRAQARERAEVLAELGDVVSPTTLAMSATAMTYSNAADLIEEGAHEAYPIQGSVPRPDIGEDVQPVKRQLVDDVVRDLISRYPGTVQAVSLPTPDTAMVRLHRGDSTWLVSVARLEVSDGT